MLTEQYQALPDSGCFPHLTVLNSMKKLNMTNELLWLID